MARYLYFLASLLCLAITLAHIFPGGALVVESIRASTELSQTVIWLSYFTWHDGTVALLISALAYGLAAFDHKQRNVALIITLMLVGFGLVGLGTAVFASPELWHTPAPYAFNVIALIGGTAVFIDRRSKVS